ncbi:MAG: PDZ domain-containing protein [Bacteroidetes bacterium]|nr:MAG: PDZ domain-containing protein [Bacteroidota bacterium]
MKKLLSYVVVSTLVSGLLLTAYHVSGLGRQLVSVEKEFEPTDTFNREVSMPTVHAAPGNLTVPTDFHLAAEKTMPAVVHIKSIRTRTTAAYDPFYELFGLRPRQENSRKQVSSGSGVILSGDGYIVTNNHVIKDADELEVSLFDNRTFKATVIGTDPSTDLGLIKIESETQLPVVELANSDEVRVGEWVLAVGNPFNLASTATAGIVSAIGRDLEIIKDQMAIESFIQTDAAVNPGNSGGALVSLEGELIGVNTAIASPTGAYAGYAFAVPANIVRKVVSDLKEYGTVQRGFIGITYADNLNGDLAREKGLNITEGVYVKGLADKGGAKKAGIEEGDVIVSIDGVKVRNEAKLLELVARNRPGDIIDVKVYREGRYRTISVQLTNAYGETEIKATHRNEFLNDVGIELRDLSDTERERLGIERGVLISRLHAGKLRSQTDIQEDFIILKVNGAAVHSAEEVIERMQQSAGTIELTGFYPGYRRLYAYSFEK